MARSRPRVSRVPARVSPAQTLRRGRSGTRAPRCRAYFEQYGALAKVELNAARSFGFVTFADAAAVDRVLATRMHQFEHAEHQTSFVEVRRPKPRGNQF